MIARNHEKIFESILRELEDGLKRSEQADGAYPYALYLGNWMADFSQLCSPDLPNMLIELLDLPDIARGLSVSGQSLLHTMQKQMQSTLGAAMAKAKLDKQALHKAKQEVAASPYQNLAALKGYADYLAAAPSGRITPKPVPKYKLVKTLDGGTKWVEVIVPVDTALSALRRAAAVAKKKVARASPPGTVVNEEVALLALTNHIIQPLLTDLQTILKSAEDWSIEAQKRTARPYADIVKSLVDIGFVDKVNGLAELAIWLGGLYKFSNPANAKGPLAPASFTVVGPSVINPKLAVSPWIGPATLFTNHIPPDIYSALFAKYFGYYKPYEHLDRFMDRDLVIAAIKARPGQATIDQKRAFRHYRTDHYAELVTHIVSLKPDGPDIDATLWRGLQIAYGRLAELRDVDEKGLPINEKLLLVGRSFHVIEDFFAHTNCVDRHVFALHLEHEFKTHPFELKKILLSVATEDAFKAINADPSLARNVDCNNGTVRDIIEKGVTECVKSGFYDTPDMVHSVVHLLEGLVKDALDMKSEQRDAHFHLYDVLEGYAQNWLERVTEQFSFNVTSKNGLLAVLARDRNELFLSDEAFQDVAKNNPLLKAMDSSVFVIRDLINFTFWVILTWYSAKNLHDGSAAIRAAVSFFMTLMKILKTLYFTPNVLVRYLKIAFSTLPDPIRDEMIALAGQAFKEVLRMLASTVFGWVDTMIENRVKYGSHSLMAKDEDTHQGRLYNLAEQLGIMIDKVALEFVFPETPPVGTKLPEARETLERLLDGFVYNPIVANRDALHCKSHGLLTRISLDTTAVSLDRTLKESALLYLQADQKFKDVPGFTALPTDMLVQARMAAALQSLEKINSERIVLHRGNDALFLTDATFQLRRPAQHVDVILFTPAGLLTSGTSGEVTVRPLLHLAIDDFLKTGKIDAERCHLDHWTKQPSTGKRCLPTNYRVLAHGFIQEYIDIWSTILIVPGDMGDGGWAVTTGKDGLTGWC